MAISRRALLGLACGGFCASVVRPVVAGRFSDDSGLTEGRFVWQSAAAPDGAVLIVVALRERIVHVYRGSHLAGLVKLGTTIEPGPEFAGVFSLSDQSRTQRSAGGTARVAWRADDVYVNSAVDAFDARAPLAILPDDFSALLLKATARGASVVVAQERGNVEIFETDGLPLLRGAAALAAATALSARSQRPVETADPMGRQAAVVVSLSDRIAHLVRAGAVEARARIEVADDASLGGALVCSLVEAGNGHLQWLGLPVACPAGAADVSAGAVAKTLSGLAFADERAGLAMAHELGRGALIYVTDAELPRQGRLRHNRELLANRPPPAPDAVAGGRRTTQARRSAKARGPRPTRTVEVPETFGDSRLARQMFDSTRR